MKTKSVQQTSGKGPKVLRQIRVRIIHTIPVAWHEDIKRKLVNKQFTAKEVMEGGVSSIRVAGDVFRRELQTQDEALHNQLMLHDLQFATIPEFKFRPSWVQVID